MASQAFTVYDIEKGKILNVTLELYLYKTTFKHKNSKQLFHLLYVDVASMN